MTECKTMRQDITIGLETGRKGLETSWMRLEISRKGLESVGRFNEAASVAVENAAALDVRVARIAALATVDHQPDQDDDRTDKVLPATEKADE